MGTVGIVVISHSRKLAEGVAELARQMGVGMVRVEPAGGDVDGGLGTSIELVERAVRAVDQGAGVVLLADLGSAVLTAKDYIDDQADEADQADQADGADGAAGNVVLADAPLVEGAVAAAAMAAAGADLAAVVRAAGEAYEFRMTGPDRG
jgi:phosphoenolpyruvate---glycerone phosphotransferase subunit DhaM